MMVDRMRHSYLARASALTTAVGTATALLVASSADAQTQQPSYSIDLSTPHEVRPPISTGPQKAGSVATSSAGTVGQRQEHDRGIANIKPMARIDTRIGNRVQSRIRNRIDRYYDPQANAISPFKVAADQARTESAR